MQAFCAQCGWDVNPLYAVLHESIYCQGAASNWAAQRVREQHFAAEFDAEAAARSNAPVMLTGEGSCWVAACHCVEQLDRQSPASRLLDIRSWQH